MHPQCGSLSRVRAFASAGQQVGLPLLALWCRRKRVVQEVIKDVAKKVISEVINEVRTAAAYEFRPLW